MNTLYLQAFSGFAITLIALIVFGFLALKIGLVDQPDPRKRYYGEVPLVGGPAIFIALLVGAILWGDIYSSNITADGGRTLWIFIFSGAILVIAGSLDDKFQLGVTVRIISEIVVAVVVIQSLDLNLKNLGALLGSEPIILTDSLSYPLTIIAIVGLINAFNMLDGLDGLLASLAISMLFLFHLFTQTPPGFISLYIFFSLLAFLISNLSLSRHIQKSFLGDAGSRLLGFIAVCCLLSVTSGQVGSDKLIPPVTALFLVGLPLFDMSFTVLRRLVKNTSPFKADRLHIHHLMQDLGYDDRESLFIILFLGATISSFGLFLNILGISEKIQFATFLAGFILYCYFMAKAWIVARELQKLSNSHQAS